MNICQWIYFYVCAIYSIFSFFLYAIYCSVTIGVTPKNEVQNIPPSFIYFCYERVFDSRQQLYILYVEMS